MNTTYGVLNNSSLIIDTDKLRENVRTILRSLPAGTKLIPVVKDDAYGMGMVGVARTLSAFPEIGCFAVANVSEGVTLRREGIRQDILIMGSTLPFQYVPAVECDLTVTVFAKGGGAGRLFGSVTTQEIADALKQSCGIELDRRKLVLDEPIKTTGIYTVRCKLGYEITADLRVEIKEQ